ncbi:MAG: hypothetical protein IJS68_02150, partial [Clostridia bacterium]|nr:hypothetical protein [Clostridia bacterium]
MIYFYIGLVVIFAVFTIWAIISVNSFKGKKKEEKKKETPHEPTFEVSKEKIRPKRVKIKKIKTSKNAEGASVVRVFEDEESANNEQKDSVEQDKDALYRKYVEENGAEDNIDSSFADSTKAPLPTEEEIERRIAEMKDRFEQDDEEKKSGSKDKDFYYGFGTGSS